MSDFKLGAGPTRRRVIVLGAAAVSLALIGVGGTLVEAAEPTSLTERAPLVGRTTTVCTVTAGGEGNSGSAPVQTLVAAVVSRQAPGREGRLTGTPLGAAEPSLTLTEQGAGSELAVRTSLVMAGEGVMATASSAATLATAAEGVDAGLAAAPCLAPATTHWFSGLGATEPDRSELVLTNADDAQATVDLRFFGPKGRVVAAGNSGLVVEGRSALTVSLANVVAVDGPLGVAVQASHGRVSAVARRVRTDGLKPIGVDWQVPSAPPAATVVIPGVPEDEGARELVVTNPGPERASVTVSVLGLQGPFAPSGAETLEVPPESSATADLVPGLAGDAAAVRLVSDQPVTGAVISSSERRDAQPDLAVQSAAAPLIRSGVSAVAAVPAGAGELVLSNVGTTDAALSLEVLSLAGVVLQTDDVLVGPDMSATRRLTAPAPAYVVVRVPDGAAVTGGVVLTQPEGPVAGLATIPLTSPDVASRAPRTEDDPSVGR